ncbi:MAG: helix-turn-helix domain-containing protein [Candidatus Diapherotrites archaeon]|uniref:Putative HTH-type transcriptional regulatory protein JW744_04860 n=1 Tax=Candidatus Iainarchaeum sp. TaxID=3101447 RepID=A0A939C6S6_9ARCH|nr:helix-turn-helix domain-containing protein [Candidatus Diapherotrites archaeon]
MRETIILKAIALLREHGFSVESFLHSNACFDLVAKRPGLTLVLKAFNNIDGLREEHAAELRKIASLFNATVLVIGEKSKAFSLKTGILYERYGLAALSLGSFKGLLNEKFPSVRYFKGKSIVELDNEKLREKRKQLGLTLQELAERLDTTVESVHRYEKGATASLSTAEKLEDALATNLIKKIDLFAAEKPSQAEIKGFYSEQIDDEALGKVHDLGVSIALFRHSPFRAYSSPKEGLLIGKGVKKLEIRKRAVELGKAKDVFKAKPLIIAHEARYKQVDHIPIVAEEELGSLGKFKDLMHLIKEREKLD